jgi:hypothetical protein
MSFRVLLNRKIRSYILSLPRPQKRIGDLIDKPSENPFPSKPKVIDLSLTNFDIKKCKGHKPGLWQGSANTGSFIKLISQANRSFSWSLTQGEMSIRPIAVWPKIRSARWFAAIRAPISYMPKIKSSQGPNDRSTYCYSYLEHECFWSEYPWTKNYFG